MNFMHLSTQAYPCTLAQIQEAHPNTTLPTSPTAEDMQSLGYVPVVPTSAPTYNPITHACTESAPEQGTDGAWQQAWIVTALDSTTAAANRAAQNEGIWQRIKAERDRRIQASGYKVGGYKVGTKWYHSDTFSRSQQMGLVMAGAGIPANTQWKTMDGTFVAMTQTLAGQIFQAAMASDMALFAKAEALKAQVIAAADPTAINITSGWPLGFGE